MGEKKMRTCAVCRQNYHFCPRCGEDKNKPAWYFTFCSSNCKDIYDITSQFENGWVTADEANTILHNLDTSKLDSFGQSYKKSIEKINVMANIVTENVIEEKQIDVIESPVVTENTGSKKPRRTKKNVE